MISIVLWCSTPIIPFFILKAEPFIFVKTYLYRADPIPPHSWFWVHYTGAANQSLSTLRCSNQYKEEMGIHYSTNICDKIRPEFFQGHIFIALQCPFHTGTDKLLGCKSGPASRFSINCMNREFEYKRIMALTSLISWI